MNVDQSINKYEIKKCPRCGAKFECKVGNITQCECFTVKLSKNEIDFIKSIYEDCICVNCLKKMKQLYNENRVLKSFEEIKPKFK
ncbi:MAG: cysteine-rich CWC family protein [Ignavibacterium sp.]|nr:cysteine-rich CWC family protein [Ignavibacterium sp.]